MISNNSWPETANFNPVPALVFVSLLAFLCGCGGSSAYMPANCNLTGINVSPATATADHAAAAPGNQQQFIGFAVAPAGCIVTLASLRNITWSVSDPVNVSISNVQDATYGVATCTGATTGAATITGTAPNGGGATASGKATLTCK